MSPQASAEVEANSLLRPDLTLGSSKWKLKTSNTSNANEGVNSFQGSDDSDDIHERLLNPWSGSVSPPKVYLTLISNAVSFWPESW